MCVLSFRSILKANLSTLKDLVKSSLLVEHILFVLYKKLEFD